MIYKAVMAMLTLSLGAAAFAQTAPVMTQVSPAPPAQQPVLTIESFAASPFIERPELSPNGRYMAAKLALEGRQVLGMFPVIKGVDKPILINLGGDDAPTDVDWWSWVNDDWLVIGVSASQDIMGTKIRIRRLMSINRLTGKINQLLSRAGGQDAANLLWLASDGTPRILVGVQNSIYDETSFWPSVSEVDVSTGKTKKIIPSREYFRTYFADASGVVRFGYGYNDASRVGTTIYRSGTKTNFKVAERANYKNDEEVSFPSLFLAAPDQALTIDDHDGYDAVYELDLATMVRGKKVFGLDRHDIDGIVKTVSGDGIAGVHVTEDYSRIHWLDPQMAATQSILDKAVAPRRARIVSWSRDQRMLLVHVGSPATPGSYFTFDRDGAGVMNRIAYVDDALKHRKLAPVSTITYAARDGLSMSAVLTLPASRAAKNLPLVVMPHGGPHVRDSEMWDWWAQFLAWRGYAVIQPNYRGSTGFGTAFLKKGDGQWGLTMQDDLNDAITHLAKDGIADPKRVCIAGGSYGGYAALRAAQRDGALFKCAISYAGVSDLSAMRRYDGQFLDGNAARNYWKEQTPDLNLVSPLKHPQDFSSPMLIIHGKADLRVPVGQSRDMAQKLKAAGKVFRYVEQAKGDHYFSRQADRLEFLTEMQAWLDKYNPVDTK